MPAFVRRARRRDRRRRPGVGRRGASARGGLGPGGRARRPRRHRSVRRRESLMPARLEIEGGVPLQGSVRASAAKNAALPALAASLLSAEPVRLTNVPDLVDVRTMVRLVETLGATIRRERGELAAQVARVTSDVAPYDLVSTMRASVLVLGPLVARHGSARVALPGGCAIGVRPIDQHLKGLVRLGAEIAIENGYVVARASRLKAARIATDLVTVTGTENLMMAAALAEGTTVIENAAREPEVVDLATLLTAMGARIRGAGTPRVEIEGVSELAGTSHRIIPDRIEAGTLIVAGAITGGDVTVTDLVPDHLSALMAKLDECGVALEVGPTSVRVRGSGRPRAADVTTSPFPGFPTDMQAQVMTLLGLADGQSRVTETIFENRFMHVAELARMGERIDQDSRRLIFTDARRGLRLLFLKPVDIPAYVLYGAADLGIVGKDILLEQEPDVYEPLDLGFGFCRLVVAEPRELWERDDPAKWSWVRVATKYPRLAEQYFTDRGIQVEIVRLDGSIELAPLVGLAERIVDLVQSGETLRANGLVEVAEITRSTARLIVNRASMRRAVDRVISATSTSPL